MCDSTVCKFCTTCVRISFARSAYFSVFTVCAYWSPPHDTFATIAVREFPLRACLSKRVSFELRNGTYTFEFEASLPLLRDVLFFPSALMHSARANSERLMFAPSRSLCPVFSVSDARSLPAKSTSDSLPRLCTPTYPHARSRRTTSISRTACDRLLVAFASVGSVLRRAFPWRRSSITSSPSATFTRFSPATTAPRSGSSRSSNDGFGFVVLSSCSPPSPSRS